MKSAYIHIPFCKKICSYCDFTKFLYQKKWISPYFKALKTEIETFYQGEELETIYIGGGTPSVLSTEELKQLFQIINQLKHTNSCEYTFECNIDSLTPEKIKLMSTYGVNRLSIGIESFHPHHLKQMNRSLDFSISELIACAHTNGITNINVDLIYALPDETLEEVIEDIHQIIALDVPHISTYSLMIEEHTYFGIKNIQPISEELDETMYMTICSLLEKHGYDHYEFSNFGKPGYTSNHNLTYWDNNPYYGFGLGASGYTDGVRYTNTKNITKYFQNEYRSEIEEISDRVMMENEMILGLRKKEGVSIEKFYQKYGKKIVDVFPIEMLLKEGRLINKNEYLIIPKEKWYVSNSILVDFIEE